MRVYERLFPNHERLVQALSVVYVDIVKFCVQAKAVFRKGRRAYMVNMNVVLKVAWKPFEVQFGDQMAAFRQHQKQVEREAGLSHMIEAADSRAVVLANQQQLQLERAENDRRRLLQSLCSIDYSAKHRAIRRLRHERTGEWLLEHKTFVQWILSTHSQEFICHGIPGSGKSVLASTIIDHLADESRLGEPVAYYYCDYADRSTLHSEQICGALLKQLLTQGLLAKSAVDRVERVYDKGFRKPDSVEAEELLMSTVSLCKPTFIVLDGLDECEEHTQRSMISVIKRILSQSSSSPIKVLIMCRSEHWVCQVLDNAVQIQVTEALSAADIDIFVKSSIQKRIDEGILKLRNKALQGYIVSELVSKAKGMFLWVYFQLDELCRAASDHEIQQILSDLPDDLGATYMRILRRIAKNERQSMLAVRVFMWTACARRPLTIGELVEAVAFNGLNEYWDASRIPDKEIVIQICQGLIVRFEDTGHVRFAHQTVQQFLTTEQNADVIRYEPSTATDRTVFSYPTKLFFSIPQAEHAAAELCIDYLSFSDFETSVTQYKADKLIMTTTLSPAGPKAIPMALGIQKCLVSIPFRALGGRVELPSSSFNISRVLARPPAGPPADLSSKYNMLNYIIEFWPWHTRSLANGEPYVERFRELVLQRNLPFEFRPWGPNQHFGRHGCKGCSELDDVDRPSPKDLPYTSLIHWAAEMGHWPLLDSVSHLDWYLEHERSENTTVMMACMNGQAELILKILNSKTLRYAVNVVAHALGLLCGLGHHVALKALISSAGRTNAMEFVLEKTSKLFWPPGEKAMYDPLDWGFEHNPLWMAAGNGHTECVKILISFPRFSDKLDEKSEQSGMTALHCAAGNGHEDIASLLLSAGASIDVVDALGHTPLMKAVGQSRLGAATVLVKAGADLCSVPAAAASPQSNSQEQFDTTFDLRLPPVHLAAELGLVDILKVMLKSMSPDQINCRSSRSQRTPLHWACTSGCSDTVRLLLEYGANPYKIEYQKWNALHLATKNGHPSLVQLLLESGTYVNCLDSTGNSSLTLAIRSGESSLDTMKVLLEHGANINSTDKDHRTPLHHAAELGGSTIVKMLLDRGANLLMEDKFGRTARDIAQEEGHQEVVDVIECFHRETFQFHIKERL